MEKKNLVKTMFFLYQLMQKKMKTVKLKSKHTHSSKMKMETEGELQPIPEDSEDEWNMIEEVFNSFMEE